MGKNLSWNADRRYCEGTNAKGQPCGNTVPKGYRLCSTHRRIAERRNYEARLANHTRRSVP